MARHAVIDRLKPSKGYLHAAAASKKLLQLHGTYVAQPGVAGSRLPAA